MLKELQSRLIVKKCFFDLISAPISRMKTCILILALACAGVRADYKWISHSHGIVPPGAVFVGFEQENWLHPLYVGRAWFNGALLPCKLVPAMGFCYISWLGNEIPLSYYQVLCDDKIWVKTSGGTIPKGAIPGGRSETGETLYIGRAYHKGLTMGKVQPSKGCMFMPYDGNELT